MLLARPLLALVLASGLACGGGAPPSPRPPDPVSTPRMDARAGVDVPVAVDAGGGPVDAGGQTDAPVGGPPDVSYDSPTPDFPPPAGGEVVVTGLDGAHVYFAGMDNRRRVAVDVEFPPAGRWQAVSLQLRLRCPANRCDFWDRYAYLGLANGPAPDAPVTEIMRFMTPYRLGADWTADVTALQPLLAGRQKLVVFVDTWVGPGHAQGDGWLVDARFTFTPPPAGAPAARTPTEVIRLWDVGKAEVGDPDKPVANQFPARMVTIPADAKAVELRAFITGHGQGNLQNCAEFCPKNHRYTVAGMPFERRIWRDDCTTTAVPNQAGNWRPSRAGWCPGALVTPWTVDVTAAAKAGSTVEVGYAPEAYVNTCRPNAPTCGGCAFNTGCAYDNGAHTAPNYLQSALLVVYR